MKKEKSIDIPISEDELQDLINQMEFNWVIDGVKVRLFNADSNY